MLMQFSHLEGSLHLEADRFQVLQVKMNRKIFKLFQMGDKKMVLQDYTIFTLSIQTDRPEQKVKT